MIKQTVVWTAVPNGVTASGQLKLVVLVSPRLATDNGTPATLTLDLYPDWKNWTTKAATLQIPVSVGGATPVQLTPVSTPNPARWTDLFPAGTLVRPFRFSDHTARNIRSYPVLNVANAIRKQYETTVVESSTEFPPLTDLTEKGLFADIGFPRSAGTEAQLLAQLDARFSDSTKALPPGPADPLWDFLQVKRFHLVRPNVAPVDPSPTPEPLEFHQVVALLMEYPAVQRQLGLAFDLVLPITASGPPTPTTVRVAFTGPNDRAPTTLATVGAGVFEPRAGGGLSNGMLELAGANFGVVAMDVDGSALKGRQFADVVRRALTNRSRGSADRQALPALRGTGIAVVRTGRAVRQVARFADAKAKDTALVANSPVNPVTVDADALLRSFRWHVYDSRTGRWYSLCQRTGDYIFEKSDVTVPVVNPDDPTRHWEEGVITAAATQRVDGSPLDFYLAEYLCRWQGESLVAPGPGKSLHRFPEEPPEVPQSDPPQAFPFRAVFRPEPGTLPPLRFGRKYRLRAFASYVGGAGRPFVPGDTSTDFSRTTAEWYYARLEPIAPPVVVMRRERTAGESVHHLVIRTNWNTVPGATTAVERHLLPPRTSQRAAEEHGMFDTPAGVDPTDYDLICARESGQLTAGVTDPGNNDQPYFDTNELSFPVEGDVIAQVPWLGDPLARGAALYGLPGLSTGVVKTIDFGSPAGWPNLLPFRLRLAEKLVAGTEPPVDIPGGRGVEMRLGKGDMVEIELSCYLGPNDLDWMQVWRWVAEANPPYPATLVATLRNLALRGRNWLLTPKQKLVLVCATRQPLLEPAFQAPQVKRDLGRTHATISDTVSMSRKSTVSVDLRAEWTDPVDTLTGSTWEPAKQVTRKADLGATQVDRSPGGDTLSVSRRHDLADTKRHDVAYTLVAKSRFAEYFAERKTVTLPDTGAVALSSLGVSEQSEEVTPASGGQRYVRDTDYTMNYPAGTITRKAGGAIAPNASVEVRFLPPITRTSPTFVRTVPSSARPDAPVPQYVIPTFGWELQRPSTDPIVSGDALSKRLGNGLRVYLDRPWWSSGAHEKLAVVLLNGATLTDDLRPYVTTWGMDPVYHSTPVTPDLPLQTSFPRRSSTPAAVSLAERAGVLVRVAPHEVAYDLARQLWYCDIELSAGTSYFPFVRLALARYQPESLPGTHLSPVALTDFAQLAPDRWLSLGYVGDFDVRITVLGHSYFATAGSSVRYGKVQATLERLDPNIPGDLGWVSAVELDLSEGLPAIGGRASWIGTVHLPVARGSERMRIVVREYDRFSGGERLVFTDAVEIL